MGGHNIDYWALGHKHNAQIISKDPYIVYPGNTQGRNSRETGEKGAFIVTVSGRKVLRTEFFETSQIVWKDVNVQIGTSTTVQQLIDDIMEEYGVSENDAENMVYTKGLEIYTSMDSKIQGIMEEEFAEDDNFTSISYTRTNEDNNLISENGVVLAYAYSNYINDGDFTLAPGEYDMNSDGSMTILKDKRLNFYETTSSTGDDISVEFKSMYKKEDDGKFYFIESGALSIPAQYKTLDDSGNCVVSAQFFTDYPDFLQRSSISSLSSSPTTAPTSTNPSSGPSHNSPCDAPTGTFASSDLKPNAPTRPSFPAE